jgi:hypothetical protein
MYVYLRAHPTIVFQRISEIMKSKLDGAGVAHANRISTPNLQVSMTEAESTPAPLSISWTQTAHERSAALRRDRIAVVAYYMSEARGFTPGHDAEDWLLAQAQVDAADAGTFSG